MISLENGQEQFTVNAVNILEITAGLLKGDRSRNSQKFEMEI